MNNIHYYYLHTNGDLIHKNDYEGISADFRESPFVRAFWMIDIHNREDAWGLVVEAAALEANKDRVKELAEKWMCTDQDALIYANRIKVKIFKDGDKWCATRLDFVNIQESPIGFGDTIIEAMANLAKALGYRATKLWGNTFKDLTTKEK